jgi:hypothetical protein
MTVTIIRVTVEVLHIHFAPVSGHSGRAAVYFRFCEIEVVAAAHTSAKCGKSQCESTTR